jgi:hypothetical protein
VAVLAQIALMVLLVALAVALEEVLALMLVVLELLVKGIRAEMQTLALIVLGAAAAQVLLV